MYKRQHAVGARGTQTGIEDDAAAVGVEGIHDGWVDAEHDAQGAGGELVVVL